MSTINPERRECLTAKYLELTVLRPMRPDANTQVRATGRAEQIIAKAWGGRTGDGGVLFDSARVRALAGHRRQTPPWPSRSHRCTPATD